MPENYYPYRKPRVNDTGKTIDELLREAKANHELREEEYRAERRRIHPKDLQTPEWEEWLKEPTHLIPPFTTRLEHEGNSDNLKPIRVISIKGFGNLTDEDIAALDPDEIIYNEDKQHYEARVKLGDLRVYKAAKRRADGLPSNADKKAARAIKEEAKLEKMKDSLHGFLRERS